MQRFNSNNAAVRSTFAVEVDAVEHNHNTYAFERCRADTKRRRRAVGLICQRERDYNENGHVVVREALLVQQLNHRVHKSLSDCSLVFSNC